MLPKYVVEIFHIIRLFLIYHHRHWGSLSWNSYCRRFLFFPHSFTYHSTFQFQLVYQSCCVVPCQKVHYCGINSPNVSAYPSMRLFYPIDWRVFRRTDVGSMFLLIFMLFSLLDTLKHSSLRDEHDPYIYPVHFLKKIDTKERRTKSSSSTSKSVTSNGLMSVCCSSLSFYCHHESSSHSSRNSSVDTPKIFCACEYETCV